MRTRKSTYLRCSSLFKNSTKSFPYFSRIMFIFGNLFRTDWISGRGEAVVATTNSGGSRMTEKVSKIWVDNSHGFEICSAFPDNVNFDSKTPKTIWHENSVFDRNLRRNEGSSDTVFCHCSPPNLHLLNFCPSNLSFQKFDLNLEKIR